MEEGTLLFRHLPIELSVEERKDLLHHLGATRVRVMGKTGSMKNTAFAVFANKDEALKVVRQLHQVEFLGSKLKVEFAHKNKSRVSSVIDREGLESKEDPDQEADEKGIDADEKSEPREIKFDETFNTWGVKQVRRPDLYYLYPPPTPTTLTNIMHALAAVPKFYVQVLHLMNKMDLPAPFGAVTSAPPVQPDVRGYVVTDDVDQQEMDISSETESELESDEGEPNKRPLDQVQVRKPLAAGSRPERRKKRPRLSDLQEIGTIPQPDSGATEAPSVSEVFEQALSEYTAANKKIELKLPSTFLSKSAPGPPLSSLTSASYPHGSWPLQQRERQADKNLHQTPLEFPAPLPGHLSSLYSPKIHQFSEPQSLDTIASGQLELTQLNSSILSPSFTQSESNSTLTQLPASGSQNSYDVQLPPSYGEPQASPPLGDYRYQGQQQDTSHEDNSRGIDEATIVASAAEGGFGILQPQPRTKEATNSEEESAEKEWTKSKFISSSELRKSRLSYSEMKEYSVFRRYNEGDTSCRLYIKNLSKQTTEEDIHWIYGRYVDWDNSTDTNIFDIRLMKEGRMKGQAFVTLPSEEAAAAALKDTNGFKLKEKPMVVQFARSAKAPDDSATKA